MAGLSHPSGIGGLLFAGCPSAVVGLVVPVIVDPVDGQVARPRTHVGIEGSEVHPPVTDLDAAPAVVRVVLVRGVLTASAHRRPDVVLSRPRHAVRCEARRAPVGHVAAAAGRGPRSHVGLPGNNLLATVASEPPEQPSTCAPLLLQRDEASIPLPRQVDSPAPHGPRGARLSLQAAATPDLPAHHAFLRSHKSGSALAGKSPIRRAAHRFNGGQATEYGTWKNG